jgi:tetratricopeptide (TPR) repeat protein
MKQMNNCLPTLAILITVVILGNTSPSVAALSPVEVQRIANKTTVRIQGCNLGSGVIIQKNGNSYTVLTAAHAIQEHGCQIVTADDREYGVTQVKPLINDIDLAVVNFKSSNTYQVAKLTDNSDRVESGENIYISGFPVTDTISEPIFTFIQGKVIGNGNKLQQRGYSIVYDNPTLPGHSGGPVWNDRGELVAIHGRGDIDNRLKETDSPNVRIKTGFNLGITINTFMKIARAMGLTDLAPAQANIAQQPKPRPVEDLIASAVAKESRGDYRGILNDMDRAISLQERSGNAINPQQDRLYYIRGNAKAELGDLKGSIADYSKDLAMNPRRSTSYYNRGNVQYKSGNLSQALADYTKAIEIEPQRVAAIYNRANVRYRLKDRQGAIADYSRAIALNPKLIAAYSSRGWVKYQIGDNRGSLADYNISIAMKHPLLGKIYSQKALTEYEMGNIAEAIESWRTALSLQQIKQDSQIGLAIALYRQGKQAEALQLATIAIGSDRQLREIGYLRDTKNWQTKIVQDAVQLLQHPSIKPN